MMQDTEQEDVSPASDMLVAEVQVSVTPVNQQNADAAGAAESATSAAKPATFSEIEAPTDGSATGA